MFYLGACREFRRGLLCGLISTDGSICISNSKAKPQLLVNFSSTSFRLAREVRLLCMSLGIYASITPSVSTTSGTPAWTVSISTPDCKREDIFRGMCNTRKLAIFDSISVVDREDSTRGDGVVFPKCVSDILVEAIACPSLTKAERALETEDVKAKKRTLSTAMAVRKGAGDGVLTKIMAKQGLAEADRQLTVELSAYSKALESDDVETVRAGITATFPVRSKRTSPELRKQAVKISEDLYLKAKKGPALPQREAANAFMLEHGPYGYGPDAFQIAEFRRLVNSDVGWVKVTGVQRTGIKEDGYDLTVPGYETFANAEGMILSNTMSMHVPVSDKAVEEARTKMLPSANLFTATSMRDPGYTPKMEMTLGLYQLTREPSNKPVKRFANAQAAKIAYKRGEIAANDPIEIG